MNARPGKLAKERYGRLFSATMTAGLSRLISLLSVAVMTPLLVRYLGQERYGVWITVSTAANWLTLLELGISPALTNRIATAFSQDHRDEIVTTFLMSFLLLGCVGIVAGMLFAVWGRHVNWAQLFNVKSAALMPDLRSAVTATVAVSLIGLPFGLVGRLLNGYQKAQIANLVSAASTLIAFAGILTVVLFRGGLPELALAQFGAAVFVNVLILAWISRKYLYGYERPRVKFGAPLALGMMREGSGFLTLQLAGLMVFNTDNFVLSHYLGPDSVTPYNVTLRFTGYATALQSLATSAIWATYAEAWAHGDVKWMARTYRQITRLTICLTGSACVASAVFGRMLISYWAGEMARPSTNLLVAMSIWTFMYAFTINQATVLGATGRIRVQAIVSIITALVNLPLAILLVRKWGSIGVISATIICYLAFIFIPQSVALRDIWNSNRREGIG